jgi:serine/threonine protein kinase
MIERTVSFSADSRSRGAQNLIVSRRAILSSPLLLLCVSRLESEVHVDLTSMSSRRHRSYESYESCPRRLLQVNPSARVSAAEALDHEWFASRIRPRSQMLYRRLLLKKCGKSLSLRIPPLEHMRHIARSPTPQTRDDCSPHLPPPIHCLFISRGISIRRFK